MATEDRILRNQLVDLLRGGGAHVDVGAALADFPARYYAEKPHNAPHSAWELLEHMRIALHDLLDFSTNPEYLEPAWPGDYWPKSSAPPSKEAWQKSVQALQEDLNEFAELIRNPKSNLYAEIPWAKDGQSLLHEALLAADHTSYHTGELVFLRRLLGVWKNS